MNTVNRGRPYVAQADLYVLVWSAEFSPALVETALQLSACDPLVCVWDGPVMAPVDYLLEFFDHVICTTQSSQWQQFLTTVEAEQCQPA